MDSYRHHFSEKYFRNSFISGLVLLIVSLLAQFYASAYATRSVSGSVTDVILSNTRVYDVDEIFIWGTVFFFFFTASMCLSKPRYLPFIVKSVAIFTLIRAFFISLTHINVFPLHVTITSIFFQETIFRGIFTGSGLFFSGHTGLPFLFALMFWDNKILRYFFLSFSLLFAVVVLVGHIHYSIDVFSAFFFAYAIFDICKFLFKRDWEIFSKTQ